MDPNGKEPAEGPFALLTLRAQSAQPHSGAQGPHTHFQPSTWEMCGPSKEAALHLTQHCSPPAPGAGKWPLVAEAFPGHPLTTQDIPPHSQSCAAHLVTATWQPHATV